MIAWYMDWCPCLYRKTRSILFVYILALIDRQIAYAGAVKPCTAFTASLIAEQTQPGKERCTLYPDMV